MNKPPGFSFDHAASFAINGSRSRSADFTANFVPLTSKPGLSVAKEYRIEFVHHTSRRVCSGDNFNDYRVHYVTSPTESTWGANQIPARYPSWNCTPGDGKTIQGFLESVETQKQRAATYDSAFGFSPIGVALFSGRAQSGYSNAVKLKFTFAKPSRGWWCGDTARPSAPGQRLMAFEVGKK